MDLSMNDKEIRSWMNLLYEPDRSTKEIIQDLLKNANVDGMSTEDRKICNRAITLLVEQEEAEHWRQS